MPPVPHHTSLNHLVLLSSCCLSFSCPFTTGWFIKSLHSDTPSLACLRSFLLHLRFWTPHPSFEGHTPSPFHLSLPAWVRTTFYAVSAARLLPPGSVATPETRCGTHATVTSCALVSSLPGHHYHLPRSLHYVGSSTFYRIRLPAHARGLVFMPFFHARHWILVLTPLDAHTTAHTRCGHASYMVQACVHCTCRCALDAHFARTYFRTRCLTCLDSHHVRFGPVTAHLDHACLFMLRVATSHDTLRLSVGHARTYALPPASLPHHAHHAYLHFTHTPPLPAGTPRFTHTLYTPHLCTLCRYIHTATTAPCGSFCTPLHAYTPPASYAYSYLHTGHQFCLPFTGLVPARLVTHASSLTAYSLPAFAHIHLLRSSQLWTSAFTHHWPRLVPWTHCTHAPWTAGISNTFFTYGRCVPGSVFLVATLHGCAIFTRISHVPCVSCLDGRFYHSACTYISFRHTHFLLDTAARTIRCLYHTPVSLLPPRTAFTFLTTHSPARSAWFILFALWFALLDYVPLFAPGSPVSSPPHVLVWDLTRLVYTTASLRTTSSFYWDLFYCTLGSHFTLFLGLTLHMDSFCCFHTHPGLCLGSSFTYGPGLAHSHAWTLGFACPGSVASHSRLTHTLSLDMPFFTPLHATVRFALRFLSWTSLHTQTQFCACWFVPCAVRFCVHGHLLPHARFLDMSAHFVLHGYKFAFRTIFFSVQFTM